MVSKLKIVIEKEITHVEVASVKRNIRRTRKPNPKENIQLSIGLFKFLGIHHPMSFEIRGYCETYPLVSQTMTNGLSTVRAVRQ